MLENTMGDDPCTGIFFSLPRLAPAPSCQRRHPPTGTVRGTRMWCPRSTSASFCTMARSLWIIGIRRAAIFERSRGRTGSSTMRAGHGGISRRVTTRGISGSATMVTAITSSGRATMIATASTAATAKAGPMRRPATIVITTGPGTGTIAADGNSFSRRGRTACRPASFGLLGSSTAERADAAGLLGAGCFLEPGAALAVADSGLPRMSDRRLCALSASSARAACLGAGPSAARAGDAQGLAAPGGPPRARAAPHRGRRRDSWMWARPSDRVCYLGAKSALA